MERLRRGWRAAGVHAGLALLAIGAAPAAAAAADPGWAALGDGATVLLRHATAPGIGDPPGFVLGDCRTQRNLDDSGRAEARHIGESFRRHRVAVGAVLASAWCRTRETAELAFPGRVRIDSRFDSVFERGDAQAAQTAAARMLLRDWHGPGVLVVVTHQVNITALTGIVPAAGEGVVVRAAPAGIETVARLAP